MRIPVFHPESHPVIPTISREFAFIVAILALLLISAGVLAQPLPGSPGATGAPPSSEPGKGAAGTGGIDCSKAANKSTAQCSQDAQGAHPGMSHAPPAGVDRGIQKGAPRTNDGMSGPNTGAGPRPSDISEGRNPQPR
ncbi:MAG TPA: hypothetical protein VGN52_09520 [Burkholderiales bacterium]